MLNTPLATLSPTSAPEATAMSASPTKTKLDLAEQVTPGTAPEDAEESKGFSDFFYETGTSEMSDEPQLVDLPKGKPNLAPTVKPDEIPLAEPEVVKFTDIEAALKPAQTAIPDTNALAVQNAEFFTAEAGLPNTPAKALPPLLGLTNATQALAPNPNVPNTTTNSAAISAAADFQQLAPPANPIKPLPPQNVSVPHQPQNTSTKGVIPRAQPAVMLSNTDPALQVKLSAQNPPAAASTIELRAPDTRDIRVPDTQAINTRAIGAPTINTRAIGARVLNTTEKSNAASLTMPHSTVKNTAHTLPVNTFLTSPNLAQTPANAVNSVAESQGQTAIPIAPNSQVIASNIGQQRIVSIKGRDSRSSLPPTADSTAVAARAKPATSANFNTSALQSETKATTYTHFNNNSQPSEAMIEWQADAELVFDPKIDSRAALTGTGIGTSRSDPVFHRPEIPRQVAAQLADIAQRMAGKSVELSLNPEELGRVRLSLTPADAGMVVTVVAERGETLDLMRRNIEILAQEFRDIGYDDVSFSFGQQSDENAENYSGNTGGSQSSTAEDQGTTAPEQQPYQVTLSPTDGIDIRV